MRDVMEGLHLTITVTRLHVLYEECLLIFKVNRD